MTLRTCTAVLAFLLAQHCFADSADWSAGNSAFDVGDYRSALRHFESARQDGLDGPAVHYNIAVCHFKLQSYKQSGAGFRLVASRYPKMRGLAEYNLGLVAQRTNDSESAINHFVRAYKLSPNNRTLRILSSNRLRELEPEMNSASKWTGALGIRAGYDDNVELRDQIGLPATQTTASPMADLFASIKGPYNGKNGFRFDGSIYVIKNFEADNFDQAEIYGGIMYDWRPGDWRLQLGIHGSAGALGGDNFDRKNGGNFRATRYLNKNSDFSLSYIYDDVREADSRFAGIAGSRQQLQAKFRWYLDDRRFHLLYRQVENDRMDAQVSPKRKSLLVDYRYEPESGWGHEADVSYRISRYDEMAVPRHEDLMTANVSVTRRVSRNWRLLINYQYSNNDSSDPVYSYDRNVITIGAMTVF